MKINDRLEDCGSGPKRFNIMTGEYFYPLVHLSTVDFLPLPQSHRSTR